MRLTTNNFKTCNMKIQNILKVYKHYFDEDPFQERIREKSWSNLQALIMSVDTVLYLHGLKPFFNWVSTNQNKLTHWAQSCWGSWSSAAPRQLPALWSVIQPCRLGSTAGIYIYILWFFIKTKQTKKNKNRKYLWGRHFIRVVPLFLPLCTERLSPSSWWYTTKS